MWKIVKALPSLPNHIMTLPHLSGVKQLAQKKRRFKMQMNAESTRVDLVGCWSDRFSQWSKLCRSLQICWSLQICCNQIAWTCMISSTLEVVTNFQSPVAFSGYFSTSEPLSIDHAQVENGWQRCKHAVWLIFPPHLTCAHWGVSKQNLSISQPIDSDTQNPWESVIEVQFIDWTARKRIDLRQIRQICTCVKSLASAVARQPLLRFAS